jgi:PAS domain S-box-containing protein
VTGVAEPLIQASLLGEAIDNGPAAVFVTDDDLRYIAVNEFACKLLGYTREELLGLSATDVSRSPEAAKVVAHRSSEGRGVLMHRDGSDVAVSYRAAETTVAAMRFSVVVCWPVDQ